MQSENSNPKFWQKFTKSNWEKKALLAKDFSSPLRHIDEQQVFLMLVEYSNHCRKIKNPSGFKLFVDGQRQNEAEILQVLPEKRDGNLLNYHSRMEQIFSDYCLVCDELLQVSKKNWQYLSAFTENLFSHVGFPNRFVEMGLYLGNYRQTPFGVHVDGCGVFSFPVVGQKTFRLWRPAFVKKNPVLERADNYEKFKKYSKTLVAKPGDMAYWPASAWHIAESKGDFSATWSLGLWLDRTHLEVTESALRSLLKNRLAGTAENTTKTLLGPDRDGNVNRLPKDYLVSISRMRALTTNELYDACLRDWLPLQSKHGFKNTPFSGPGPKVTSRSLLQICESQQILWTDLKSQKKTIYAFHGKIFETSRSPQLKALVKNLNRNQICLVTDYLKGNLKKQDLKIVKGLAEAGAFRH